MSERNEMACNALRWLQDWYLEQCDGDWEHQDGVKIRTLDNPGWSLEIDLTGTDLENRSYTKTKVDRTEHDWIVSEVLDGKFRMACGPLNLLEAIETFRSWVDAGALERFERRKVERLGG
jgi:hypothetical protein